MAITPAPPGFWNALLASGKFRTNIKNVKQPGKKTKQPKKKTDGKKVK